MQSVTKVLFLTQGFIRHRGDVASVFLFDLSKALLERGTQVSVLAPHQENLSLHEEIDAVEVHRFRYATDRYERLAYEGKMHETVLKGLLNKLIFASFMWSFTFKATCIARRPEIGLVHAHWWVPSGIAGLLAAAFARKPYVVTSHGTDVFITQRFHFLRPLARVVFGRARVVTAVSNSVRAILIDELGIDPAKIKVFPMPSDLELFHPVATPRAKVKSILSIGRLIKRKGYDYLIEAAKILNEEGLEFSVTIIGEGPEAQPLREMIARLGLEQIVTISPYHPKSELIRFYNACDAFVLPSITDWKGEKEGLGLVLVEAMLCERPVIGTLSGGIVDVIEDGETGLLVPEKDPKALADALQRVLLDDELASRLARRGRTYAVENFTTQRVTEKMLSAYSEALRT